MTTSMERKIAKGFLISVIFILFICGPVFASSATTKLFVFLSTDNFVGVELRASTDTYSHLYANIGINQLTFGLRLSSKQLQGLYISPGFYMKYASPLFVNFSVGYTFKVSGAENLLFLLEAGGKKLFDKPESFINFAVYLPF